MRDPERLPWVDACCLWRGSDRGASPQGKRHINHPVCGEGRRGTRDFQGLPGQLARPGNQACIRHSGLQTQIPQNSLTGMHRQVLDGPGRPADLCALVSIAHRIRVNTIEAGRP